MKNLPFFREKAATKLPTPTENEGYFSVKVIDAKEKEEKNSSRVAFSLNDSDDDLSANLLSSVFGVIEERRKILTSISQYRDQVSDLQEINASILEEKRQQASSLKEREKQLESVQFQLQEWQDKYRELMDEQKTLRVNELRERQRLQQQIKELQGDYESLSLEFKFYQENTLKETIAYKDALREEKEKFNHLQIQHTKLSEDNKTLMDKIAVFAKQISTVQMFNSIFYPESGKSETENS